MDEIRALIDEITDILAAMSKEKRLQFFKQYPIPLDFAKEIDGTTYLVRRMSGIPLTTNPPFGYCKDPDSPKEWKIDEPATEIVRQIFTWCVSGLGPTQIAKRLKAAQVPTPAEYWNRIGRKCSHPPERPCN